VGVQSIASASSLAVFPTGGKRDGYPKTGVGFVAMTGFEDRDKVARRSGSGRAGAGDLRSVG